MIYGQSVYCPENFLISQLSELVPLFLVHICYHGCPHFMMKNLHTPRVTYTYCRLMFVRSNNMHDLSIECLTITCICLSAAALHYRVQKCLSKCFGGMLDLDNNTDDNNIYNMSRIKLCRCYTWDNVTLLIIFIK